MKKKLLSIVLSVVMLASLLVPMFVATANETAPKITLSLGTPEKVNMEGVDYLAVPVNVSENTQELFALRYLVMSKDAIEIVTGGFLNGDFTAKIGSGFTAKTVELGLTLGQNTPDISAKNYTGFQVVQDSSYSPYGINTASGTLGTAYFELPTQPGVYTFVLETFSENEICYVYEDGNGVRQNGNYVINIGNAVTYSVECPGHTGGTATCKDKAVCSVCGVEYGEKDATNHAGGTEVRGYDAPSCNEGGYTGDTYCLGCEEKIDDGEPINPTGAHVDADNKWETNETQHFHTCSCGEIIDAEDHKGGEATCKDKAVCSVCNVAYGEKNATNHAGGTEVKGYVAPSCNESGYTGDTYCLGCNTKIADGEPINPTGAHVDADNKWETNGTQHFHTCGCGAEFDKEDHKGGEATCKDKAVCSVCGVAYGEKDANNHKGTTYLVGQKETSCYEPGYTGDTYCSDCNVKIATGTSIEMSDHSPASVWSTDDTHHWKECTVVACGNIVDKAEHTGGEATCTAKAVCSVCNVAYGTTNANNHKNTELRAVVAAECNTPGYTGDTWCLDCDTKIATGTATDPTGNHVDADNKWESNGTHHFHTCACGTEFDKEDHFGGEANCKNKAVCYVCEKEYGEIDADNHDFSGKVTIKEEPTSEKGGKYTVECVNGCGNSDERDSKKLANSIEDKEAGVTIKSDEAILPEDITLTIDESTAKEEDGKYSVTFNFTSQLVNTLSGKAEFALSLEDTDDMDNIQISVVNADGTTTVISEIKDGKLVFSADLDGTYVLSFTDKVEDEKKEETPKTSDSMNIAVVVLVALVAAAGLAVVGKKRIAL